MHRLFGKSKPKEPAPPEPTLSDASTSINNRVAAIDSKIKGLDEELRRFRDQLKKATGTTKANITKRAMETMKRKKMYEQQRDQLAGQAFNVEQTAFAIESVQNTQVTIAAMKTASKQLKVEQKKINLSEIEDMQDDLADLLEDGDEIQEILARSYGTPEGLDEDELEAELACLGDELDGLDLDEAAAPHTVFSSPSAFPAVTSTSGPLPTVANSQLPASQQKVSHPTLDEFGLPV